MLLENSRHTHLSAATSDGFRGGSVFKAGTSQGVFHLPQRRKSGRGKECGRGEIATVKRLEPGGTDAAQT